MNHLTWEIPRERQRSQLLQTLDDLRFTLQLAWQFLIGPFVSPPPPLTHGARLDAPPVIIVPGFICRPAIYRRLQAAIHQAGFACHILNLGFQVGSIVRKARDLSEYIDQIEAKEVLVIGHSMGGLVVTTSMHQGETRIRHAWTLGTPLWGTSVIYGLYALGALALIVNLSAAPGWDLLIAAVFLSPALRQMMPGSDLVELVSHDYPYLKAVTSVFCQLDLIAFANILDEPGSATRFGRGSDVLFPEAGHNNLAMGDNAIRAMVAALREHMGSATAAPSEAAGEALPIAAAPSSLPP